jgi:23S rRNA (adenine2503-C2)-methyltransferase
MNRPKTNLLGLSLKELEDHLQNLGDKRFHGRQLFSWIHRKGARSFEEMTNLSKGLRERLKKTATIEGIAEHKLMRSKVDGTEKFLWKLSDRELIESVLIPDEGRLTLCLSTQVGCPLDCRFCATATVGFRRNLTSGEMVSQLLEVQDRPLTNLVFMGMGEPLLNYDNLLKSIGIMVSDLGPNFSAKKITVSTVGIVPGIHRLAEEGLKLGLAISLNAPDDKLRSAIMPVNGKYPLKELLSAAKFYAERTDRRITFEYVLIGGVNDSLECAKKLSRIIQGIPCKINLIRFNPHTSQAYQAPEEERVIAFRDYLYPRAPAVTLRESKGRDILAACGQLRAAEDDYTA